MANGKESTMYYLIESITGEIISESIHLQTLIDEYNNLKNSEFDPYFEDLTKAGGYLRIENHMGAGFFNC